ncbi:MAG: hypothetical protein D9V47_13770 [Clostridia bacterium]|nr:MAG: hypothetical protein D9V47_13770 [Clostridia bacterium]
MWRGTLWFMLNKQKIRGEVFHWQAGRLAGGKKLRVGVLTTRLLRLDYRDAGQVEKFLGELGNPPIFDLNGNVVGGGKISRVLAREQNSLWICVDRLLAERPGYKLREDDMFPENPPYAAFYKFKPSARVQLWQPGSAYKEAAARLAKVGLELGTILKSWEVTGEQREKKERLTLARMMEIEETEKAMDFIIGSIERGEEELERLEEQWREQQEKLIRLKTQDYKPIFKYVTHDVLALPWLEVFTAAEKDIAAKECEVCKVFYLHAQRRDSQVCCFCKPPSRIPVYGRPPEEQEKTRLRERIYKQYKRGKLSLKEANVMLRKEGLKEIRPPKKKK